MPRWPLGLLTITVAALAGCSDLSVALRDELALESEIIDRVSLISNENAAKEFSKGFKKKSADDLQELGKKKAELIENFDKKPRKLWNEFVKIMDDYLKAPPQSQADKDAKVNPADDTDWLKKALDDVVDLGKPNVAKDRIDGLKLVCQGPNGKQSEWDETVAALPTAEFLNRYIREKLSAKITRQREIFRLKALPESPAITEIFTLLEGMQVK